MDHIIKKEWDRLPLLHIIRHELHYSMAALKHLKFIENGIMLNGEHATVKRIAHEGDILSLKCEDFDTPSEKLIPCNIPLPIVYEDSELVIPCKPTDMPTHPSHGHNNDTVANALAYIFEERGVPFVFRPVNRLDRNTSGLLLIAKNRLSASALSKSMKNGEIKKQYIAILDGILEYDSGIIDTYIRRTAESIIVRENCAQGEGGDRALTEYRVIARSSTNSLVIASPITGRTHQLRVHFSGLGCPISGDDMYGTPHSELSAHALHAYRLEFKHPNTGKTICVTAPIRQEMTDLCKKLFPSYDLGELDGIIFPKIEKGSL